MLADSAPVGIFELARGMRVTYANAEGLRLLGERCDWVAWSTRCS